MNKTELFKRLRKATEGSIVFGSSTAEELIEYYNKQVEELVAEGKEISFKVIEENGIKTKLEVSNGQFILLPKPKKFGKISVHSSFIKVAGVRIDNKNIIGDSITEDSFKTIHGGNITYK